MTDHPEPYPGDFVHAAMQDWRRCADEALERMAPSVVTATLARLFSESDEWEWQGAWAGTFMELARLSDVTVGDARQVVESLQAAHLVVWNVNPDYGPFFVAIGTNAEGNHPNYLEVFKASEDGETS